MRQAAAGGVVVAVALVGFALVVSAGADEAPTHEEAVSSSAVSDQLAQCRAFSLGEVEPWIPSEPKLLAESPEDAAMRVLHAEVMASIARRDGMGSDVIAKLGEPSSEAKAEIGFDVLVDGRVVGHLAVGEPAPGRFEVTTIGKCAR